MKLIFDIETDNFLDKCTKIHCIVAKDYDTGTVHTFNPATIKLGLEFISKADVLIGHNIIDFDIRAIKKLYPKWNTGAYLYDTLIVAKYAFPDIKERDFGRLRKVIAKPVKMRTDDDRLQLRNIGKHSLEAYGIRLKLHKGTFGKDVGFETFSQEMLDYCMQDVEVNTRLYHKLMSLELNNAIIDKEFEAKKICLEQTSHGFQFNKIKAFELQDKLLNKQKILQDEIKSKLGGPFIIQLDTKVPKTNRKMKTGTYTKGAAYTKNKIKEFNPTSRHDVSTRLIERFGWKPQEFGADQKPTLSEEILENSDIPVCKTLSELFMIQKRLGMLSDGRQAWLKLFNEDTQAIHGNIDTLGTGTHRCTHSRPNLGQIPSTRAPWGKECRELFTTPKGWKLFGTDASGLELRMLAHYMAAFDDGKYADVILKGDIHTTNQEAAGLPTRNDAKTFIYALLYGAGNEKIGSIIGGSKAEGGALKRKFFKNTPAMKIFTDKVKEAAEHRGYVKSLDGRRIPVRSSHSAPNFLLQSSGAVVCKYWMIELHKLLKNAGFEHGKDFKQSAFVHDELQIAFNPERITGEELGYLSKLAMVNVKEQLNVRIDLDADWSVGDTYADTH